MTDVKLSTGQERLLVQLVSSSKTLEEIHGRIHVPYRDLMQATKELLLRGAIERKKGYPTYYRISKDFHLVAKKLRAKVDMSDLMDDPCDILKYDQKRSGKIRQQKLAD